MQESILFMVFFLAKDGALILGHHRVHWTGGQGLLEVLIRQWQIALILIGYAQDGFACKVAPANLVSYLQRKSLILGTFCAKPLETQKIYRISLRLISCRRIGFPLSWMTKQKKI